MAPIAWICCLLWIGAALAAAALGARRASREGRAQLVRARLQSPTVYLFAAYLAVAGFVTPTSPGESSSPLLWLALVLPLGYALASLSAAGARDRPPLARLLLALLHGGAVLAAAAVVLALASPAFVPKALR
ncbi:MAG: hypothetical protein ABI193_21980 [Minicystis sp.]